MPSVRRRPAVGHSARLSRLAGPPCTPASRVRFAERWLFTADVCWMNIETDAKVDGAKAGAVNINPRVYGLAVGYRF